MYSAPRTSTLLAICALALALVVPASAFAQGGDSPADETYVLDVPSAGESGSEGKQGSQGGSNDGGGVPAAAADSADEGGLPILLVILAGTALAGASIAIMRRQKT